MDKETHTHLRLGHWYAFGFETAGEGDKTKVIVHEVCIRQRSLRRTESAHLVIGGPMLQRLFGYLLSNWRVLGLRDSRKDKDEDKPQEGT